MSNEVDDTEPRCPYRQLAASVVTSAVHDYIRSTKFLAKPMKVNTAEAKHERFSYQIERELAIEFLLGKTDIAQFWLSAAGMTRPLTESEIPELIRKRAEYAEKIVY